jgi:hypothetical protein
MQDVAGKEGVIAYLSRRVVDAETRYTHVERLCLALYYACSKLRQYLLSSPCTVVSQYDVMRHDAQAHLEWTSWEVGIFTDRV